jgi:hypothetical protein
LVQRLPTQAETAHERRVSRILDIRRTGAFSTEDPWDLVQEALGDALVELDWRCELCGKSQHTAAVLSDFPRRTPAQWLEARAAHVASTPPPVCMNDEHHPQLMVLQPEPAYAANDVKDVDG